MGEGQERDKCLDEVLTNPLLIQLLQEIRGKKDRGADDDKEKKHVERSISPELIEKQKVAVDWFKKHMISSEHDEEKQMALESQLKHLKVL